MMMKYKLANKQNKRFSSSEMITREGLSRSSPVKTSSTLPLRVSLCSESEKEDSSSIASSSSSSDSIGNYLVFESSLQHSNGACPFGPVKESTKLALPYDICFAPISAKRRLSFEISDTRTLDGQDWSFLAPSPTQVALVSPRLTPDSTVGPPFQGDHNHQQSGILILPETHIPTTDIQEAANLLLTLKKKKHETQRSRSFTLPRRCQTSQDIRHKEHFGPVMKFADGPSLVSKERPTKKRELRHPVVDNILRPPNNKRAKRCAFSTNTPGNIDNEASRSNKRIVRLAMADDSKELNSLHCFVRSDLLEVFVMDEHTRKHRDSAPRVGFRCVHCGHLSRKEKEGASMSIFYPKSLQDIYRSVCTWQRIHFKACRHVPQELVQRYDYLKEMDRTRGKKQHWVSSAYRLGLRDLNDNRGGIVWDPERP